jgi:hypothetical protein
MSDLRDDSRCARCGTAFRCGIGDAGGCWCTGLPPLPRERLDADAGCLCPACLAALTGVACGGSGPGAAC